MEITDKKTKSDVILFCSENKPTYKREQVYYGEGNSFLSLRTKYLWTINNKIIKLGLYDENRLSQLNESVRIFDSLFNKINFEYFFDNNHLFSIQDFDSS